MLSSWKSSTGQFSRDKVYKETSSFLPLFSNQGLTLPPEAVVHSVLPVPRQQMAVAPHGMEAEGAAAEQGAALTWKAGLLASLDGGLGTLCGDSFQRTYSIHL